MKLKKYEAPTEEEAIEMVKQELGMEALILNIKKVKPRGMFSLFKNSYVEVTAAYDDKPSAKTEVKKESGSNKKNNNNEFENNKKLIKQQQTINELEKKLNNTEELLDDVMKKLSVASHNSNEERKYENSMLQFFYDKLTEQGVSSKIAEVLLKDIDDVEDFNNLDINLIIKIVYNRVIKILGQPKVVKWKKNSKAAKNIIFIGPTGVGKTTTIAKLSSYFILNENASVGFITADTYRIAAVEQLKTYAEILNVDVGVVYNVDDLIEQIGVMKPINDLLFIDTAGRSHKNKENLRELKEFLDAVPEPEIYLVLSVTTKYEDLLDIISAYDEITDFKIIFTKLDETKCIGSILNICYTTGKEISYATNGQNVPDDIEVMKPEKIVKALLGSMYK